MLLFGLLIAGGGALLAWDGIVDPPGGVFAELGRVLAGKPLTKPTRGSAVTGAIAGANAALGGTSSAGSSSAGGGYNTGTGVGGDFLHAAKRAAGLARATAMIGTAVPVGQCLHYAAVFYGHAASGLHDAAAWWSWAPNKHPGDRNPPPGALVAWTGGSNGYGHVGVADGFGNVISTDFPTAGRIGRVKLSSIGGSLRYAGWAEPDFRA